MHWKAHWRDIRALALSPDTSTIVSGDVDGNVFQWDVVTGEQIRVIRQPTPDGIGIYKIAYSPDGTKLGVSWNYRLSEGLLEVYDTTTWQLAYVIHDEQINDFTWKPNGEHLAIATIRIRMVNAVDGQDIPFPAMRHKSRTHCIAYTPDGKWLVSGGDFYDPSLALWNATTFESSFIQHNTPDEAVAEIYDPYQVMYITDSMAIINDQGYLLHWNFAIGQIGRLYTFPEHPLSGVTPAAISIDGRLLVYSQGYAYEEIPNWQEPSIYRGEGWARPYKPAGARVIVYDLGENRKRYEIEEFKDSVNCFAFSPDATKLYTGDWEGYIRVWELE